MISFVPHLRRSFASHFDPRPHGRGYSLPALRASGKLHFGAWILEASIYLGSGVEAVVGATDGFGRGGFVAAGEGNGGATSTDFVGEGRGRVAGFPLFEFSLAFWFAPPRSIGVSLAVGDAETFAF